MPRILNLCHNCAILRNANDTECDNCGSDRDPEGWIKAKLSDEDAERLEKIEDILMDYLPE